MASKSRVFTPKSGLRFRRPFAFSESVLTPVAAWAVSGCWCRFTTAAGMIGREGDMKVVAEAKNGLEAVQKWSEHQPDVLLLDLRMPELDGVRLGTSVGAVTSARKRLERKVNGGH